MEALAGLKTYIVGAVSIVGAWVGVWAGTNDITTAIQLTQAAVLAMTIRHGIATT